MKCFKCFDCKESFEVRTDGGTGYADTVDKGIPHKICYACCAVRDKKEMIATGHSRALPLYLTELPEPTELGSFKSPSFKVSNWPGSLEFPVYYHRKGRHNIAGSRVDVWFTGPNGEKWWGYQLGDFTQIVHCRRVKAD